MSLFVDVSFQALLSAAECQLIRELPDWPTQQKLTAGERFIAQRLQRLGCIRVERCKDDPMQMFFDVYAGVTPLGRESVERGIVRLS